MPSNIYPSDFESKLGFDQIRARITNYCLGELGAREVNRMAFSPDHMSIEVLLKRCDEFKKIIEKGETFPLSNYADPTLYFDVIRVEDSFLEEENIVDIINVLQASVATAKYLLNTKEEYPELNRLTEKFALPQVLISSLENKFNEKGKIKDNASPELARIRKRLREEEGRVRKLTDQIFRDSIGQSWVPEGATLTVRDGRVVIPVLAEHKRKLKGFILDESATGQTVYIEPAESMEVNNEIRDLLHADRREVIKILKEMTALLRQNLDAVKSACIFLGLIDFNRAKARLALDLNAIMPVLVGKPELNWIQARHPLLYLSLKGKREVVPLTIDLLGDARFLLVSGPNAGGKSVCLKTVGLIQYMVQCGILVPVYEKSTVGVFDQIFLDIGDQQSIDNDLSTYSSHLKNMNFFLQRASASTLVLMDELGSGTDPNFGGGIAEAILSSLVQKKTWGVATTHYYNLKLFASNRTDIRNASMQFDTKRLQPLFQLEIGKPGSSFALEIARKTGLPSETLEQAEQIIGKELTGLETLMKTVAEEKQQLAKRQRDLSERERKAQSERDQYHRLNSELEAKKKEIVERAKAEASSLLKETNREIEKTIRHIKESKAEKKETRKVREGLEKLATRVQQPVKKEPVPAGEVKEGDKVRITGQEVTGTLVSIKGNQAIVEFGSVRSTVKLNQLVRSDLVEPSFAKKYRSMGVDVMQKQSRFDPTLDLRGKRAEEVMPELERFLDDAILLSQGELKILHGKGEGVLRKIVREHLRKVKQVASFADEHVERGGDGITVVVLK
ncbi:endonuclease MutS2 [Cytophagales bacterium WSM2-2]|nr:endonuclease MutS2 [Cytophagales bacterium WSM2-2]